MVLGVGLKMRVYSLNATDPKQIKSAYLAVAPIVKNTKIFDSDSPKDALLANQVAAGVVWNGEVCAANRKYPDIKYIYPREGFALWIDSLCIPKSAPNLAEAYALINYLLRPEVSATISSELGYATPYAAARELLGPEIQKNPMVYPPTQDFARGEKVIDVGAAIATYEKYWMLLRAKK